MDISDVIGVTKSLRIRIKTDVTKPLHNTVELQIRKGEKMVVLIKYEKLLVFCYVCGSLGMGKIL
ncbi:Glycerol kinase [Bienertia sinuspersici]